MLLTDFAPQRTESYKYKIEVVNIPLCIPYKALHTYRHVNMVTLLCADTQVRVERTSGYFWRRVPPTKTCTLSADSEPPGPVTELSVTQVQTDREGGGGLLAQFHLSWSVPLTTNGVLTEYEVNVVTGAAGDGTLLYHSTHPVSVNHQKILYNTLLSTLFTRPFFSAGKPVISGSQSHIPTKHLHPLYLCSGKSSTGNLFPNLASTLFNTGAVQK